MWWELQDPLETLHSSLGAQISLKLPTWLPFLAWISVNLSRWRCRAEAIGGRVDIVE